MSDIFRKPTSGDEFVPSARQFGAFIDAAGILSGRRLDRLKGRAALPELVLVRNDTGADLTEDHPVVGLDDPIILPTERDTVIFDVPCFSGVTPDVDDHTAKFAILTGPCASGAIRLGVIKGVTWCKLQVDDEAVFFADVEDGDDTRLITNETGFAQVLWKPSGTGEKTSMVRLGCCHVREYTVRSWEPDGTFRYQFSTVSDALSMFIDGTDIYVSTENGVGPDGGVLQKWSDIDTSPANEWYSDPNSLGESSAQISLGQNMGNNRCIMVAGDGAVWTVTIVGTDRVHRYDSSGVLQQSTSGLSGPPVPSIVANGNNAQFPVGTNSVTTPSRIVEYNTSHTLVDTSNNNTAVGTLFRDVCPRVGGTGWVRSCNGGAEVNNRAYDNTLASVGNTGVGVAGALALATNVADDMVFFINAATFVLRAIDASLTSQWSVASSGSPQFPIFDAAGDIFYIDGEDVVCLSQTDGSETWRTTMSSGGGSATLRGLVRHTTNIIVCGVWDDGTDFFNVAMLDVSDGSVVWEMPYSTTGVTVADCTLDADGNVYACGALVSS